MPLTHRDNHSFIFLLCEFDFLKEHGFVSVIFVTDGRNMYHAPSIRHLVKRSGQEVPQQKLSGHCVVFVKPEILGLTHGL